MLILQRDLTRIPEITGKPEYQAARQRGESFCLPPGGEQVEVSGAVG
jgi:hypothetical protein